MHPPELERQRALARFDPVVEGVRYKLSRDQSLALWERVRADATDRAGRCDTAQAERRFHELAARMAARGQPLRPDVGRQTRVGIEAGGNLLDNWNTDESTTATPGRTTLVATEALRSAHMWEPAQAGEQSEAPLAKPSETGVGRNPPWDATVQRLEPPERRLPIATLDRMERAFGERFDDVEVDVNSVEVPSGVEAFTRGRHIFFGHGAFDPDSEHGEHVIAHELAHVAQQSRPMGPGGGPPTRTALEADAHQAALSALAGRAASVSLFAPAAAALGFSSGASPGPATARGAPGSARSTRGGSPTQAPGSHAPRSSASTGPAIARPTPGSTAAKAHPASGGATTGPAPTSAPRRSGATGDRLLVPEPPGALTPAASGRLQTIQTGNRGNAMATTALPTGQQQTDVGRAAVEEPQAEQDARAQHGVVSDIDNRPPPSPEIEEACARIRQVIRDKRPPDEDRLVEARPREMAQEAGHQMSGDVQQRADTVRKGYDDMQQPPPGAPSSEPVHATLPPTQAQTQPVDATTGTPDPLHPDDVSLDADVTAQQKEIQGAGMNTEPGKLVQDGPIGDARGGVGDLEAMAKTDPEKVIADQAAAIAKAQGDMRALQASAEKALADARAGAVDQMATHTTGVKGSEEQQRAQAGDKMKAVFTGTQKAVDALLQPLSANAVARWDSGVAQLSTDFEASLADVKRRIDERHSGLGGLVAGAWDWATGLPDWVTQGYDRAEAGFADGATRLIRDISRDVNAVIESCKKLIEQARKDIDAVVKSLPASLQTWAQGEATKLNQQLDALDKRVDQTQKAINKDLVNHANGAVQQVRERVHDLREKAKGALAKIAAALVEFAKNPAKAIVNGLLHILGIPPDSFWGLIDRLGDVVGAIAKDPVKFGKTLISGAAQGFAQFFENFPQHLREIMFSWLFGTVASAGVPMPSDFSGPGIMATVLGVVGIDSGLVTSMLGGDLSDPAEMAEAQQELAGVLSGDPKALVALLREHFDPASLIPLIREAALNFLIQALITRVAARIAALLVPGGAILQAVEAIFRVLMWVVTNAARIFTLIESLVGAAGQAVAGNIGGVAGAVESSLVQIIVLVIDFLAGYLGLGGLPGKLKGVLMKLGGKLKGALKKVIDAIAKRAKARAKAKHRGPDKAKPHADKSDAAPPKHDDRDPEKAKDDTKDPRNHRRDPDDKDPRNHRKEKTTDNHQDDRSLASRKAHATAKHAWAEARAATTPRVLSASQLDGILRGAAGKEGKGATVAITLLQTGKVWSIASHVRINKASETATTGHGWIASEPGGRPWFAATDLTAFNRKVIEDAYHKLTRSSAEPETESDSIAAPYHAKVEQARQAEDRGQAQLDGRVRGLVFSIKMAPFEQTEQGRQIKTHFRVAPNSTDEEKVVSAGSGQDSDSQRLSAVRTHFGDRLFSLAELVAQVRLSTNRTKRLVGTWLKAGALFEISDKEPRYSFNATASTSAAEEPPLPQWTPSGRDSHPNHGEVNDAMNQTSTHPGILAHAIDVLVRDLKYRRWDMQIHGGGDSGHRRAYELRRQELNRLVGMARVHKCRYNPAADDERDRPFTFPTGSYS